MHVSFQHIPRYCAELNIIFRIASYAERWRQVLDPATRQISIEFQHSGFHARKNTDFSIRAYKVMVVCYFTRLIPCRLISTNPVQWNQTKLRYILLLKIAINDHRCDKLPNGAIRYQWNMVSLSIYGDGLQRSSALLPLGSSPQPPMCWPDVIFCDFHVSASKTWVLKETGLLKMNRLRTC